MEPESRFLPDGYAFFKFPAFTAFHKRIGYLLPHASIETLSLKLRTNTYPKSTVSDAYFFADIHTAFQQVTNTVVVCIYGSQRYNPITPIFNLITEFPACSAVSFFHFDYK